LLLLALLLFLRTYVDVPAAAKIHIVAGVPACAADILYALAAAGGVHDPLLI
jgi:hypothetical protein